MSDKAVTKKIPSPSLGSGVAGNFVRLSISIFNKKDCVTDIDG